MASLLHRGADVARVQPIDETPYILPTRTQAEADNSRGPAIATIARLAYERAKSIHI